MFRSVAVIGLVFAMATIFVGCESHKVDSGAIELVYKISSADVVDGKLSLEKNLNTDQGNPWADFAHRAVTECKGQVSVVSVSGLAISLENADRLVTLDKIFSDEIKVSFAAKDDANADRAIQVGTSHGGAGKANADLSTEASTLYAMGDLDPILYPLLGSSEVRVVLEGKSPIEPKSDGKTDVVVTLKAVAFCQ